MTTIRTESPAGPIPVGYTGRDRALDADGRLESLDGLVWHAIAPAVKAGATDANDAWLLLKVAAGPLVGHERGSVKLADDAPTMWAYDSQSLGHGVHTVAPDNDTERFMRTSAAWDAITKPWLTWLDDAERGRSSKPPVRRRRESGFASARAT